MRLLTVISYFDLSVYQNSITAGSLSIISMLPHCLKFNLSVKEFKVHVS